MSDKTPLEEAAKEYAIRNIDYVDCDGNDNYHYLYTGFEAGARWLAEELMKEAEWVDLPGLVTARVVREEDIKRLIGEKE